LELLLPRTVCEVAHLGGNRGERFGFGVTNDRRDQPALECHRHAGIGMLEAENTVARPDRVGGGNTLGAAAQALMTKSLSESLNAGWPSLFFGAAALASSRIAIKRPASRSVVK